MKHTIKSLLIILFLGISTNLFSQVGELRNNFSIGVNGGMNFNKVTFTPNIQQTTYNGINGGISMRYISEKYFAMICGALLEVNYAQRGWEEVIEDGSDNSYNRTMNYLEIPFLAHLAFGKEQGQGMRFFIHLGPQIAFLLSESESKGGNWDPAGRFNAQYKMKVHNKFDYGITGGLGAELRTKAGNFLVEGRYYFGLSDFYNNSKKDVFSRSAHAIITAKLSYLFDLKK